MRNSWWGVLLLAGSMGCLDTNVSGGDVGVSSSAEGGSAGDSVGSSGTAAVGNSGGITAGPTGTGSGSSTGEVAGASAGTSGGVGTTTGGEGTSSGGGTTGGTTTGGPSLEQACTDYYTGAAHLDDCTGASGPFATVQQCEAMLAVCTAQDDAIIDGVGLCFQSVDCDSGSFELDVLSCAGDLWDVSAPCFSAATADAGGQPP